LENIIFGYLRLKDEVANKKQFYIKTKTKKKRIKVEISTTSNNIFQRKKRKKRKKDQLMTNWTTTRDTRYTTGKWHNDASNNTMKRYFWMPGDKACASHTPPCKCVTCSHPF